MQNGIVTSRCAAHIPMFEKDIYGRRTDYPGNKHNFDGTLDGPGAATSFEQLQAGVGPFDTLARAQDKVWRARQAKDLRPGSWSDSHLPAQVAAVSVSGTSSAYSWAWVAIVGLMAAWALWRTS